MNECGADIICLQEIKAEQSQLNGPVLHGYNEYWHSSQIKKGYSGTLILSKSEVISLERGFDIGDQAKTDVASGEGRVLTAEFDDYFVVNVYTPNSQDRLKRINVRMAWDAALLRHLTNLESRKPVILCGDINVAHKEIDLAHPDRNRGTSGFSDQEREGFGRLLASGFVDAFRHFEKGPDHYTWWRFNKGTREKNLGWRIDYFVVSEALLSRLHSCYHLPEIMGSDHCPVVLEIDQADS